jgi:hypothetical protein
VNSHKDARLGFTGRVCLIGRVQRDDWSAPPAAPAFRVSDRTVRKWLARYRPVYAPTRSNCISPGEAVAVGWLLTRTDARGA